MTITILIIARVRQWELAALRLWRRPGALARLLRDAGRVVVCCVLGAVLSFIV